MMWRTLPEQLDERAHRRDRVVVRLAEQVLEDAQGAAQLHLGLGQLALRLQQQREVVHSRRREYVQLTEELAVPAEPRRSVGR